MIQNGDAVNALQQVLLEFLVVTSVGMYVCVCFVISI